MEYEIVMGLEVHCELATKTKIFCACTTEFGGAPNTHCCPVCTGMPGTLPVLNKSVVDYAIRTGLATNCEITRYNQFDRKNYFYPDLPKAYQVSQLYLPICRNGEIEVTCEDGSKKPIRIKEIHMEEDAGKLVHDDRTYSTCVDYNRCGVPLLEIVSEPDFRSAAEVLSYLENLKSILQYIGVSDCKMQEGSLRADVNLSVRPAGATALGTRTEMKNMNSFKMIARAIESEAKRQIGLLEDGEQVEQETRRWDDGRGRSYAMRSKENAQDYRYFPEPDIPPIEISDDWILAVKESLPELRRQKTARYKEQLDLSEYDAARLTESKTVATLFEETVRAGITPKSAANWILSDIFRELKERELSYEACPITPSGLAELIRLVENGEINRASAKKVLQAMLDGETDPRGYAERSGLKMTNDSGEVESVVKGVLADNAGSVEDYKGGKTKAFTFLMGQCMRALRGKADPGLISELLTKYLN